MVQIKLNIPETTAAIGFNYICKNPDGSTNFAGIIVDAMTMASGEVTLPSPSFDEAQFEEVQDEIDAEDFEDEDDEDEDDEEEDEDEDEEEEDDDDEDDEV